MPPIWMLLREDLDRDLSHRSMLEEAPAIGDFAAHEDVANDRHRVDKGRVLIDRLDTDWCSLSRREDTTARAPSTRISPCRRADDS